MPSVFDFESGVLAQPRWTASPNCAKVSLTKVVPVTRLDLERNMKAERVVLWCSGAFVFLLEHMLKQPLSSEVKYFRAGVAIFMVDQLACMVSMAAWTTNRNSAGARLSPCLTPDIELHILYLS